MRRLLTHLPLADGFPQPRSGVVDGSRRVDRVQLRPPCLSPLPPRHVIGQLRIDAFVTVQRPQRWITPGKRETGKQSPADKVTEPVHGIGQSDPYRCVGGTVESGESFRSVFVLIVPP